MQVLKKAQQAELELIAGAQVQPCVPGGQKQAVMHGWALMYLCS